MIPNWTDIAVLAIVGVFVFAGWKNGLVKMGFRLLSFAVSIGLAWLLHPYLAEFLQTTPLYESLFSAAADQAGQGTAMPETFLGLGTLVGNAVTEYFAKLLLNGISFLLILVLARVLLFFARKILNFVASLPVIGFFNRGLGMAMGLLEGLLVVYILLAVLAVVPHLRENKPLGYAIEQSAVTRGLYQSNPVLNLLMPEAEPSHGK